MRGISLAIFTLFFATLFNGQSSFAAQKLVNQKSADNTIITKIKSNFIDIKRQDEVFYLYGNVIVEREDLSVLADKMLVFYYETPQDKQVKKISDQEIPDEENIEEIPNKTIEKTEKTSDQTKGQTKGQIKAIKRIEAKDNVKIFNDEFVATGKFGVFDPKENNFILEDDVVLNKGGSVATGQKFVYNLTTKKGDLTGQKVIKNSIENQEDPEHTIQDSRVIVIINDADVKKSQSNDK